MQNRINPEPDWNNLTAIGAYIGDLLAANPMTFHEDHPPYYSPGKDEPRFDRDLATAALAEGLTAEEIAALLAACHSNDPDVALDAYRDVVSGRWKVCPCVIKPYFEREDKSDPRLWLSDWAMKHRQGKPF